MIIDTGVELSGSRINSYAGNMGQAYAGMPDVSGYDIDKMWGDSELSVGHKYLSNVAGCRNHRGRLICGFRGSFTRKVKNAMYSKKNSAEALKASLAPFKIGSEVTNKDTKYNYIAARCDMSLFLTEKGQSSNPEDYAVTFGDINPGTRNRRVIYQHLDTFYRGMGFIYKDPSTKKDTKSTMVDNVCMFLA